MPEQQSFDNLKMDHPARPPWKPELLAPAKNLERLKVAVKYGADAVYVGGQNYGLRARADNFTETELSLGVAFAHEHQAKVYVTLNAFLHDADFEGLADYSRFLADIGVDAVIISDLGVLKVVQRSADLDIHLSTQASCLNAYAARLWREMGVKRLIVGRELSIVEGGQIREAAKIEVEMFIHGALCMAYSGHCTISNFTAGRDSNRGGCAQSCRFPYHLQATQALSLVSEPKGQTAYHMPESTLEEEAITFMSSKDLWGLEQICHFFQQRICSLKIEGRMKSALYVATTCKTYRHLIDAYAANRLEQSQLKQAQADLTSMPHRDYFAGSLDTPAGATSVYGQLSGINTGRHKYLGLVLDTGPEQIILRLYEPLAQGDQIEVLPFQGPPVLWTVSHLYTLSGQAISTMRSNNLVRLPRPASLTTGQSFNVVRLIQPH